MDFYLNFLVGTLSTCTATACVSLKESAERKIGRALKWYSSISEPNRSRDATNILEIFGMKM